jgi:hypothetical protein
MGAARHHVCVFSSFEAQRPTKVPAPVKREAIRISQSLQLRLDRANENPRSSAPKIRFFIRAD